MSLKSVDLLMAVHRNGEVGNWQQQLNNKPLHDQALLAGQNVKMAEQELKKATGLEQTEHTAIRGGNRENERRNSRLRNALRGKKPQKDKNEMLYTDPYKGRHIDCKL